MPRAVLAAVASETLRPAVKLNKHFLYPRLNLGVVLNRQGKFKEADMKFDIALRSGRVTPAAVTTALGNRLGPAAGSTGLRDSVWS